MSVPSPKAIKLAQLIAKAEGFGGKEPDGSPNLPSRCHNPCDLENGDVGYGEENGKTKYPDDAAGWMAGEHQCDLILTGLSRAGYRITDTIWEFAVRYTGNDGAAQWAQTVAQGLGLSVTNTLQDYLNQQ
jgi:hypothetical protein